MPEDIMKRIIGLAIVLLSMFSASAKEIPLQVTETEWGWEISNLDAKGKRICKGFLDFQKEENVYVVFKTNNDIFSVEKLANEIVYNYMSNTVSLSGENFSLVNKNKKTQLYGPLLNYDSILVISSHGKIEDCSAYSDGKNLCLRTSVPNSNFETQASLLVKNYFEEKKAEEDRLAAEKKSEEDRLAAEQEAIRREAEISAIKAKSIHNYIQ